MIGNTIRYKKDGDHDKFEGIIVDKINGAWSSHTVVAVTKYVVRRNSGSVDVIMPTWIISIELIDKGVSTTLD